MSLVPFKKCVKMTHFRCHTALHLKSSLERRFSVRNSSARARGRLKLPSAPSPFPQEVLAAVHSVARTRLPGARRVGRATPPGWSHSANTPDTL